MRLYHVSWARFVNVRPWSGLSTFPKVVPSVDKVSVVADPPQSSITSAPRFSPGGAFGKGVHVASSHALQEALRALACGRSPAGDRTGERCIMSERSGDKTTPTVYVSSTVDVPSTNPQLTCHVQKEQSLLHNMLIRRRHRMPAPRSAPSEGAESFLVSSGENPPACSSPSHGMDSSTDTWCIAFHLFSKAVELHAVRPSASHFNLLLECAVTDKFCTKVSIVEDFYAKLLTHVVQLRHEKENDLAAMQACNITGGDKGRGLGPSVAVDYELTQAECSTSQDTSCSSMVATPPAQTLRLEVQELKYVEDALRPNTRTLELLLSASLMRGAWSYALTLVEDIGVPLTDSTLRLVLRAYQMGGALTVASHCTHGTTGDGSSRWSTWRREALAGGKGNSVFYRNKFRAAPHLWQMAYWTFQKHCSCDADPRTVCLMLLLLRDAGKSRCVIDVYRAYEHVLQYSGMKSAPSEVEHAVRYVLTTVSDAAREEGDWALSLQIWSGCAVEPCRRLGDVHTRLVQGLLVNALLTLQRVGLSGMILLMYKKTYGASERGRPRIDKDTPLRQSWMWTSTALSYVARAALAMRDLSILMHLSGTYDLSPLPARTMTSTPDQPLTLGHVYSSPKPPEHRAPIPPACVFDATLRVLHCHMVHIGQKCRLNRVGRSADESHLAHTYHLLSHKIYVQYVQHATLDLQERDEYHSGHVGESSAVVPAAHAPLMRQLLHLQRSLGSGKVVSASRPHWQKVLDHFDRVRIPDALFVALAVDVLRCASALGAAEGHDGQQNWRAALRMLACVTEGGAHSTGGSHVVSMKATPERMAYTVVSAVAVEFAMEIALAEQPFAALALITQAVQRHWVSDQVARQLLHATRRAALQEGLGRMWRLPPLIQAVTSGCAEVDNVFDRPDVLSEGRGAPLGQQDALAAFLSLLVSYYECDPSAPRPFFWNSHRPQLLDTCVGVLLQLPSVSTFPVTSIQELVREIQEEQRRVGGGAAIPIEERGAYEHRGHDLVTVAVVNVVIEQVSHRDAHRSTLWSHCLTLLNCLCSPLVYLLAASPSYDTTLNQGTTDSREGDCPSLDEPVADPSTLRALLQFIRVCDRAEAEFVEYVVSRWLLNGARHVSVELLASTVHHMACSTRDTVYGAGGAHCAERLRDCDEWACRVICEAVSWACRHRECDLVRRLQRLTFPLIQAILRLPRKLDAQLSLHSWHEIRSCAVATQIAVLQCLTSGRDEDFLEDWPLLLTGLQEMLLFCVGARDASGDMWETSATSLIGHLAEVVESLQHSFHCLLQRASGDVYSRRHHVPPEIFFCGTTHSGGENREMGSVVEAAMLDFLRVCDDGFLTQVMLPLSTSLEGRCREMIHAALPRLVNAVCEVTYDMGVWLACFKHGELMAGPTGGFSQLAQRQRQCVTQGLVSVAERARRLLRVQVTYLPLSSRLTAHWEKWCVLQVLPLVVPKAQEVVPTAASAKAMCTMICSELATLEAWHGGHANIPTEAHGHDAQETPPSMRSRLRQSAQSPTLHPREPLPPLLNFIATVLGLTQQLLEEGVPVYRTETESPSITATSCILDYSQIRKRFTHPHTVLHAHQLRVLHEASHCALHVMLCEDTDAMVAHRSSLVRHVLSWPCSGERYAMLLRTLEGGAVEVLRGTAAVEAVFTHMEAVHRWYTQREWRPEAVYGEAQSNAAALLQFLVHSKAFRGASHLTPACVCGALLSTTMHDIAPPQLGGDGHARNLCDFMQAFPDLVSVHLLAKWRRTTLTAAQLNVVDMLMWRVLTNALKGAVCQGQLRAELGHTDRLDVSPAVVRAALMWQILTRGSLFPHSWPNMNGLQRVLAFGRQENLGDTRDAQSVWCLLTGNWRDRFLAYDHEGRKREGVLIPPMKAPASARAMNATASFASKVETLLRNVLTRSTAMQIFMHSFPGIAPGLLASEMGQTGGSAHPRIASMELECLLQAASRGHTAEQQDDIRRLNMGRSSRITLCQLFTDWCTQEERCLRHLGLEKQAVRRVLSGATLARVAAKVVEAGDGLTQWPTPESWLSLLGLEVDDRYCSWYDVFHAAAKEQMSYIGQWVLSHVDASLVHTACAVVEDYLLVSIREELCHLKSEQQGHFAVSERAHFLNTLVLCLETVGHGRGRRFMQRQLYVDTVAWIKFDETDTGLASSATTSFFQQKLRMHRWYALLHNHVRPLLLSIPLAIPVGGGDPFLHGWADVTDFLRRMCLDISELAIANGHRATGQLSGRDTAQRQGLQRGYACLLEMYRYASQHIVDGLMIFSPGVTMDAGMQGTPEGVRAWVQVGILLGDWRELSWAVQRLISIHSSSPPSPEGGSAGSPAAFRWILGLVPAMLCASLRVQTGLQHECLSAVKGLSAFLIEEEKQRADVDHLLQSFVADLAHSIRQSSTVFKEFARCVRRPPCYAERLLLSAPIRLVACSWHRTVTAYAPGVAVPEWLPEALLSCLGPTARVMSLAAVNCPPQRSVVPKEVESLPMSSADTQPGAVQVAVGCLLTASKATYQAFARSESLRSSAKDDTVSDMRTAWCTVEDALARTPRALPADQIRSLFFSLKHVPHTVHYMTPVWTEAVVEACLDWQEGLRAIRFSLSTIAHGGATSAQQNMVYLLLSRVRRDATFRKGLDAFCDELSPAGYVGVVGLATHCYSLLTTHKQLSPNRPFLSQRVHVEILRNSVFDSRATKFLYRAFWEQGYQRLEGVHPFLSLLRAARRAAREDMALRAMADYLRCLHATEAALAIEQVLERHMSDFCLTPIPLSVPHQCFSSLHHRLVWTSFVHACESGVVCMEAATVVLRAFYNRHLVSDVEELMLMNSFASASLPSPPVARALCEGVGGGAERTNHPSDFHETT